MLSGKKRKIGASILSMILIAALVLPNTQVFAASNNEIFNAKAVSASGTILEPETAPMLGIELQKNLPAKSSFQLTLANSAWNIPTEGTLQSLWGNKDVYEGRVNDSRAVPFGQTNSLPLKWLQQSNYEKANITASDYSNIEKGLSTKTGLEIQAVSEPAQYSVSSAIEFIEYGGIINKGSNSFRMVKNSAFMTYTYDANMHNTSHITWESNNSAVAEVGNYTSLGYAIKIDKKGPGEAKITGKAMDNQGVWIKLIEITIDTMISVNDPSVTIVLPPKRGEVDVISSTYFEVPATTTEFECNLLSQNTTGELKVISSDPSALTATVTDTGVKFKSTVSGQNKFVTLTMKSGELTLGTYLVRVLASKKASITDIAPGAAGFQAVGTSSVKVYYSAGDPETRTGLVTVSVDGGLSKGDTVQVIPSQSLVGIVTVSQSQQITADNQVNILITELTHLETPSAGKIYVYKGVDEIIALPMYIADLEGSFYVQTSMPVTSKLIPGIETDYILPEGNEEGVFNVAYANGTTSTDYLWKLDAKVNQGAASLSVSENQLTLYRNNYLTKTVPVVIQCVLISSGEIVFEASVLLQSETQEVTDQHVYLTPATGSPFSQISPNFWEMPISASAGTFDAVYSGIDKSAVTFSADNSILSLNKSGNQLIVTRNSVSSIDTDVNITVSGTPDTFKIKVKGMVPDTEPKVETTVPSGSDITYDEGTNAYTFPSNVHTVTLGVQLTNVSPTDTVTFESNAPLYIETSLNAARTILTLTRVGDSGQSRDVIISVKVNGETVRLINVKDMGGLTDNVLEPEVSLSSGTLNLQGTTIRINSTTPSGNINVNSINFVETTQLSFTVSDSSLLGALYDTNTKKLTLARLKQNSTESTITLNVILNGSNYASYSVVVEPSEYVGDLIPLVTFSNPVGIEYVSVGSYNMGATINEGSISVSYENITPNLVTWTSDNPSVGVIKTETGLSISRLSAIDESTTVKFTATKTSDGSVIGSLYVYVYASTQVVEDEFKIIESTNISKGTTIDYIMTKDSLTAQFVVNYYNLNPDEVIWKSNRESITIAKNGNNIVLTRTGVIPEEGLVVTIEARTVTNLVILSKDVFIPATTVVPEKGEISVSHISGGQESEEGVVQADATTKINFLVLDSNGNSLPDFMATSSNDEVVLTRNGAQLTAARKTGSTGVQSADIFITSDGFENKIIKVEFSEPIQYATGRTLASFNGFEFDGDKTYTLTGTTGKLSFDPDPQGSDTSKLSLTYDWYKLSGPEVFAYNIATFTATNIDFDRTADSEHESAYRMRCSVNNGAPEEYIFVIPANIQTPPIPEGPITLTALNGVENNVLINQTGVYGINGYSVINTESISWFPYSIISMTVDKTNKTLNIERLRDSKEDVIVEYALRVNQGEEYRGTITIPSNIPEEEQTYDYTMAMLTSLVLDEQGRWIIPYGTTQASFRINSSSLARNFTFTSNNSTANPIEPVYLTNSNSADRNITFNAVTEDTEIIYSVWLDKGETAPEVVETLKFILKKNSAITDPEVPVVDAGLQDFKYKLTLSNVMEITVPEGYNIENGKMLYIPLTAVMTGTPATVTVKNKTMLSGLTEGTYTFAVIGNGGTSTTVKEIQNFDKEVTVDGYKISEQVPDTIRAGKVNITLSAGFELTGSPTVSFSKNIESKFAIENIVAKGRKISFDIKETGSDSVRYDVAGYILINGIAFKVPDKEAANYGNVTLKISGEGITTQNVTVAKCVETGLHVYASLDAETIPVIYAGRYYKDLRDENTLTNEFTISESEADEWNLSKKATIDLPEGVTVRALFVTSATNLVGIDKGTIFYNNLSTLSDDGAPIQIDGNEISFRYLERIDENLPVDLTMQASLSIAPDFQDDEITVDISNSDNSDSVLIAYVAQPLEVTYNSTVFTTIPANATFGDIKLTEYAAKALTTDSDQGISNIYTKAKYVDDSYAKGDLVIGLDEVYIESVDKVETVEGDLRYTHKVSNGKIYISISRESKKPTTILLSGVKGKPVDGKATVPSGGYALKVGGNAVSGNYYDGKEKNIVDNYDIEALIGTGYIVNKTSDAPGNNANTNTNYAQTAAFKLNSNLITLSDGQTIWMDQPPVNDSGRVLLPLRFMANVIGIPDSNIYWNNSNRTATLTNGKVILVVQQDNPVIWKTDPETNSITRITMDVPAKIKGGRFMLPVRAIAEAFGIEVLWEAITSTVTLNYNKVDAKISQINVNETINVPVSSDTNSNNMSPSNDTGVAMNETVQIESSLEGVVVTYNRITGTYYLMLAPISEFIGGKAELIYRKTEGTEKVIGVTNTPLTDRNPLNLSTLGDDFNTSPTSKYFFRLIATDSTIVKNTGLFSKQQ